MITAVLVYIANRILGNYQQQLETLATTDVLTKTSTRQVLDSYFTDITTKPAATVSLILLDIDDFKKENDTYGHNAGDRIIKAISEILLKGRRENDLTCRWGGEEFILLLPNTTLSIASEIAERLRVLIASKVITVDDVEVSISASFGVVERLTNEAKLNLINRADMNLYHAKNLGKNCVVTASI